jgi:hypothetical protein
MRENGRQPEATSALTGDELLKVLIDKVVENGTQIGKVKDQLQKLQEPSAIATTMDQRMTVLEERSGTIKEDVAELKTRLGDPGLMQAAMTNLQVDLQQFAHLLEHPKLKEVHYKYFLGRPLLTLTAVLAIIALQFAWLTTSWNKAALYQENAIKWRAAMLSEDSIVTNALNKYRRDYNANADQFGQDVIEEEERRTELYQQWQQEREDQQKIHELQDAKKKRY